MKEKWRYVPNENGLFVISSLGRVAKIIKGSKLFLTVMLNKDGYCYVSFCTYRLIRNKRVHRLVALAFVPNPYNKPQVNHKNGVKTDNRVENLEWCTAKENIDHSIKNGLKKWAVGEKCGTVVLNNKKVIRIKKMLIYGNLSHEKIADKFNVCRSTVSLINQGKTWKHINI